MNKIYQETDTSKNMSYQAIVNAVDNLVAVNLDLAGQFIVLNQWNYWDFAPGKQPLQWGSHKKLWGIT
jgi:hypothetical protein